jgi:hypothetical protein
MRTTAGTTVGTTVDVDGALALLQRVGPDYAWYADALRATAAAEEDLPNCALQAALVNRRVALARTTFLYLRWKLETDGPSNAANAGDAAAPSRAEARTRLRTEQRALAGTEGDAAGGRLIRDGQGRHWHVAEHGAEHGSAGGPDAPAGAGRPRSLVFTSGGRRRHVHACPDAWRTYPDDALAALLPTV